MKRLLDEGLEKLTNMILDMASISSKVVELAIDGYVSGRDVSKEVFQTAQQLRILEDEVVELGMELIARYQPVASDLRYIRSCMEIAYGFLRYGRYAYDISQVLSMFGDLRECKKDIVQETGKKVCEMIRMSVTAFKNRDVELAKKLELMDDEIDEAYVEFVKQAIENPLSGKKCDISITLILRYLERIADHATYIGESVEYIITGERAYRR
ncbi:MAG: phosphate uptake regulator, PhoU [Candidatus Terraquivivens tikiterensis]|uniref:Phosphate-specific transport system accessory protein PhoU n=1 Tax=Candidatus Terraquivivens tikiterensis TaxID=1980982 RepID=A0A2R7Y759_9ARCH|nr:MAG: phosphate uptake regulator, PhoU [Candidatus Terraquivivens tikiterensis]